MKISLPFSSLPPSISAQKFEILFICPFTDLRPEPRESAIVDPRSVLTLLVKKGPCEGRTLQRRAGAAALRVGRVAKGNDLSVRDAGASQRHLSVEFLPPPAARWAVTDLGSSNGTLLNGTPLVPTVPAPLSDGDLIKIGESTVPRATQRPWRLGVPRATQRPWRRRRRKRNRALRFRAGPDGGRPVRRKPPKLGMKWKRKLHSRLAEAGGRRPLSPLGWRWKRKRRRRQYPHPAVAGRGRLQRRSSFRHSRKMRGQRELLQGEVRRWGAKTMRGKW
jgi:hypothetical protein